MVHPVETFYTSDLHLGHPKVAEIRGFSSVKAHDEAVLGNLAACLRPRDRLFVLGDFTGSASRRTLIPALLAFHDIVPGEKHLIAGNHDGVHPMARPRATDFVDYGIAFASIASAGSRKINGTRVLLSHFPYTRDRAETRYPQWRLPNLGEWLLHGHTHGTEKATVGFSSKVIGVDPANYGFHHRFTYSREIHVGLDAWDLSPVHSDHLADLIKENTP